MLLFEYLMYAKGNKKPDCLFTPATRLNPNQTKALSKKDTSKVEYAFLGMIKIA
jgi:hypothetical protein